MPQIQLQPTDDAYLMSDVPSAGAWAGGTIVVGFIGEGIRRALLKFDLTALPAGATVTAAALNLYASNGAAAASACHVYLLASTAWVESAVSWNNRAPGTSWSAPGGDYHSEPSAAFSFGTGFNGNRTIDVTALLQQVRAWGRGSLDLLIRRDLEAGVISSQAWGSSESGGFPAPPLLTVDYALPNSSGTGPAVGRSRINRHHHRLRITGAA